MTRLRKTEVLIASPVTPILCFAPGSCFRLSEVFEYWEEGVASACNKADFVHVSDKSQVVLFTGSVP